MSGNAKQLNQQQVIVTDMEALLAHIKGLEDRNAELLAALNDLLDEQNDAPLERRREEWEAAMEAARAAILKAEKTLPS